MKPFDYGAAGYSETHDRLSSVACDRLSRLARWHREQGPEDWPIDSDAPWIRFGGQGRHFFCFQSTGDGNADYAIGAELALTHLKARRPFGVGIDADPDPAALALFHFAKAISNADLNEDIQYGFWGAFDTLLDAAMCSPSAYARAIARLDLIDHAECAARLEAIGAGYTPADLVLADSFGLLTRPGESA